MSTFLRLDFPLTVSQGFHGELQFPSHGPFPQLFAFFLGNLEESRTGGFGRSEQKLTWSLHWREQEAPGSHARACVLTHTHTHTHDSPSVIHSWKEHSPNYPKAPLGVLHPIRSNSWGVGADTERRKRETIKQWTFPTWLHPHPHLAQAYYHHLLLQWMQLNASPCLIHWEPEMLLTNYLPSSPLLGLFEPALR